MNIIQSYWSRKQNNLLQTSHGWLTPEYNLFSWALSCLQLRQYYDDVVLYADSTSAKVLIDTLKLPYTDVKCNLDSLNTYHKNLWALPKIYAYSLQEKPFLHVDGDIFIWEKFDKKLCNSKLIAQNKEIATNYYETKMQRLEKHLKFFPSVISQYRQASLPMHAYNAGIFGGTDINFIKRYTEKAFEFVDKNINSLDKIDVNDFNTFFEQFLFYCLAEKENRKVSVLINELIGDNEYKGFGDFMEVPYAKTFLHLLGTFKRVPEVCYNLARKLRQCYPEYYYRIIELFKKQKLPLLRDYYHSGIPSERKLTRRYKCLRAEPIQFSQPRSEFLITTLNVEREDDVTERIQLFIQRIFPQISPDILYKTDIHVIEYCENVFSEKKKILNKIIATDGLIKLFEVKTTKQQINEASIRQHIEVEKNHYLAAIPECDALGYTIVSVDELDILLLENLYQPLSISDLLRSIESNFDKDDLNENRSQFEELIFGRLKKGFENKLIRHIPS